MNLHKSDRFEKSQMNTKTLTINFQRFIHKVISIKVKEFKSSDHEQSSILELNSYM